MANSFIDMYTPCSEGKYKKCKNYRLYCANCLNEYSNYPIRNVLNDLKFKDFYEKK